MFKIIIDKKIKSRVIIQCCKLKSVKITFRDKEMRCLQMNNE